MIVDTITKAKYVMVQVIANCNPSCHLEYLIAIKKMKVVIKSVIVVNGKAWLSIGIDEAANVANPDPLVNNSTNDLMSQGKPKQNRMSKIFDPKELQIAMSASLCFFTKIMLVISSGIDVPAARIVIPETLSGIPNV